MFDTICSYCSENNLPCGPKLSEVDHTAFRSPLWNGLNVSWEVIESRYEMGEELGTGSYARVIEVCVLSRDFSEGSGNSEGYQ